MNAQRNTGLRTVKLSSCIELPALQTSVGNNSRHTIARADSGRHYCNTKLEFITEWRQVLCVPLILALHITKHLEMIMVFTVVFGAQWHKPY
jgi:hypothetical protein